MSKCRRLSDGRVCDYFIFGVDILPDWYIGDVLVNGSYVVKDSSTPGNVYRHFHEFDKNYRIISEKMQPSSMEEDTNRDIVQMCMNKSSGELCDYFIYGVDKAPEWYGDLGFVAPGSYVVHNSYGNIRIFDNRDDFEKIFKYFPEYWDHLVLGVDNVVLCGGAKLGKEESDKLFDVEKECSILEDDRVKFDRVKLWLDTLAPDVLRYILLREIKKSFVIDILNVYKKENNG